MKLSGSSLAVFVLCICQPNFEELKKIIANFICNRPFHLKSQMYKLFEWGSVGNVKVDNEIKVNVCCASFM